MTLEFDRKRDAALAELEAAGIWRSNAYPPIFRMLHRFGVETRLPHYQSFLSNFFAHAVVFAVFWGLLMWAMSWRSDGTSFSSAVTTAGAAGVFFGLIMATYCAIQRRRHSLTPWDQL